MQNRLIRVLLLSVTLAGVGVTGLAGDWHQWRGSNRNGAVWCRAEDDGA